jgi:AmiR/NasT family two-component response regulator
MHVGPTTYLADHIQASQVQPLLLTASRSWSSHTALAQAVNECPDDPICQPKLTVSSGAAK